MDVRQLRHFVAVAETLHFGRAAERLGMTQPPLSQSIMALERDVGAPLFERTRRTVALTPFGAQWLPHVRAALDGRDYVVPDDIKALATAVLRHRLILSAAAEIEGRDMETLVAELVEATEAPR